MTTHQAEYNSLTFPRLFVVTLPTSCIQQAYCTSSSTLCTLGRIDVNLAGDTSPENWTAGNGDALCPPMYLASKRRVW